MRVPCPDGLWRGHDRSVTWTAPDLTRAEGSLVAGEQEMLKGFLTFYRSTFLLKCAGLTGEQLAARAAAPSNLSLLGLIRHLAKVERIWFRQRFAGEHVEPLYARTDVDYDELDPARAEEEYEQLVDEWRLADAATEDASLDDTFEWDGEVYALRLVYLHMIGEYARHCGHADIVREHLDGVTGA
jgi:hypothetical protein